MKLTESALGASRLTFFVAALVLVAGVFAFLKVPSQEEPSTTIRDAMIFVSNPGLPVERMEQLVARPLEERLRQLPELKHVGSTVRTGLVIVQVNVHENVADLPAVWQKLRAKVAEVSPQFPDGTLPADINDDFGRVAVASIAVTAPGYAMSEMREPLKQLRDRLYELPGVQSVSFHGLQDERVYIEFDRARLAGLGLDGQRRAGFRAGAAGGQGRGVGEGEQAARQHGVTPRLRDAPGRARPGIPDARAAACPRRP